MAKALVSMNSLKKNNIENHQRYNLPYVCIELEAYFLKNMKVVTYFKYTRRYRIQNVCLSFKRTNEFTQVFFCCLRMILVSTLWKCLN